MKNSCKKSQESLNIPKTVFLLASMQHSRSRHFCPLFSSFEWVSVSLQRLETLPDGPSGQHREKKCLVFSIFFWWLFKRAKLVIRIRVLCQINESNLCVSLYPLTLLCLVVVAFGLEHRQTARRSIVNMLVGIGRHRGRTKVRRICILQERYERTTRHRQVVHDEDWHSKDEKKMVRMQIKINWPFIYHFSRISLSLTHCDARATSSPTWTNNNNKRGADKNENVQKKPASEWNESWKCLSYILLTQPFNLL